MTIKNFSNSQRQLNELVKKIEDRKDLENLTKHRLESLSSKQLTINIPDDLNFAANSHEIDLAVRLLIDTSLGKNPKSVAHYYFDSFQEYMKNLEQPTLTT